MGINPGAPGWSILEWFQNNIRNVEMVCSITVIKQTFYGTVLEKFLMIDIYHIILTPFLIHVPTRKVLGY